MTNKNEYLISKINFRNYFRLKFDEIWLEEFKDYYFQGKKNLEEKTRNTNTFVCLLIMKRFLIRTLLTRKYFSQLFDNDAFHNNSCPFGLCCLEYRISEEHFKFVSQWLPRSNLPIGMLSRKGLRLLQG